MSDGPTGAHRSNYHPGNTPVVSDGRLLSEVFLRNSPPVIAALVPWLSGRTGAVLEIGCGTGQHSGAFRLAFPGLHWQASDPDPVHRASTDAWAAHLRLPPRPALALDAAADWATAPEVRALGALTAVLAMNVLHITPFAVTEGLLRGAGTALAPGGLLLLYGPFKVHGDFIGEGNRRFDQGLRADNPDWGLRDIAEIEALGAAAGLEFANLQAMPANNRLLALRKSPV